MRKNRYNHQEIETKWQTEWEKTELFQHITDTPSNAEKLFLLFAFAYPSGSGLHVGHVESKTALDILARFHRMHGKQVFFPVGWDAFGLPAENYAIKTGVPPAETTKKAIQTFKRQIKRLGISYDWSSEVATSHPEYYRWTQWLFLQLYNKNLAYRKKGSVNWCPSCQTVLANEQVVNGTCERCGSSVVQKDLEQWYFKITKYQDELISGLDQVDWPNATKQQQLNWIGKKEGLEIEYAIDGINEVVRVFTTRPETNFGATFVVVAPEHELAKKIANQELFFPGMTSTTAAEVQTYLDQTKLKTELERQKEGRTKSGVFTGLYAINQLNGRRMPIWISDFVLSHFGTGAVVGVPAHDVRDFQFASQFNIPIERVVVAANGDISPVTKIEQVQEAEGTMINSDFLDGLDIHTATEKMMDYLEMKGWGHRVKTYKLRDWLISRQRYWGAPIPIVYDPEGNAHPVKEEHLPWLLPTDVEFRPTGESPLALSVEFRERTERLYGKGWRPEYDTMDTFVDSSWYYLRYVSARNTTQFSDAQKLADWLPVDLYMIGPEHIVLHLLYSRFFTKFLRDEGYLQFDEPFAKMRHQGMILGPDGKKMSKSKGNVINPDEVVEKFGADTLRVYEMFMGPLESDKPWSVTSVAGVYRFLQRVESLVDHQLELVASNTAGSFPDLLQRSYHQTLRKVSDDIPKLKFNTAIASCMELINDWESVVLEDELAGLSAGDLSGFIRMLAPFAPFLSEELWHRLNSINPKPEVGAPETVHLSSWPVWDEQLAQEIMLIVPVQVNGRVRVQLEIQPADAKDSAAVQALAQAHPKLQTWLEGQRIIKVIYVPGKILNFVVQPK